MILIWAIYIIAACAVISVFVLILSLILTWRYFARVVKLKAN